MESEFTTIPTAIFPKETRRLEARVIPRTLETSRYRTAAWVEEADEFMDSFYRLPGTPQGKRRKTNKEIFRKDF
jgi:hypothetical protein